MTNVSVTSNQAEIMDMVSFTLTSFSHAGDLGDCRAASVVDTRVVDICYHFLQLRKDAKLHNVGNIGSRKRTLP